MRYFIPILLLFSCVLCGCKSDPLARRETSLLRAEILDLEDQYYEMKSKYESTLRQLRECRGEPIDQMDSDIIYEDYTPMDGEIIEYSDGIIIESPSSNPSIQPSVDPTITPEELPPGNRGANLDFDQLEIQENQSVQFTNNVNAEKLRIHSTETHGQDVDGQPGDEGLVLLVQPTDGNGQVIASPAAMTVSILDPQAVETKQRIGLWRFEPAEIELFTNANSGNRGILLHLPWNQNLPQSGNLLVFVRYTTDDGRDLETSSQIRINPPSEDYSKEDPVVVSWTQQGKRWDAISQPNWSTNRGVKGQPVKSNGSIINRPKWRPVR